MATVLMFVPLLAFSGSLALSSPPILAFGGAIAFPAIVATGLIVSSPSSMFFAYTSPI